MMVLYIEYRNDAVKYVPTTKSFQTQASAVLVFYIDSRNVTVTSPTSLNMFIDQQTLYVYADMCNLAISEAGLLIPTLLSC